MHLEDNISNRLEKKIEGEVMHGKCERKQKFTFLKPFDQLNFKCGNDDSKTSFHSLIHHFCLPKIPCRTVIYELSCASMNLFLAVVLWQMNKSLHQLLSDLQQVEGEMSARSHRLCAAFFREEVTGRSSLCLQPAVGEREPVQASCVENFGLGMSRPSAAPGLQQPNAETLQLPEEGGRRKPAAEMSLIHFGRKRFKCRVMTETEGDEARFCLKGLFTFPPLQLYSTWQIRHTTRPFGSCCGAFQHLTWSSCSNMNFIWCMLIKSWDRNSSWIISVNLSRKNNWKMCAENWKAYFFISFC